MTKPRISEAGRVTDGRATPGEYPDTPLLVEALGRVLRPRPSTIDLIVVDRRRLRGSTFPVEIVTARVAADRIVSLFCKYEAGLAHEGFGHRGGVRHEAKVYAKILGPLRCSTPAFIGRHIDRHTGDTWLFLEAVGAPSIANAPGAQSPASLRAAANWIGRFHRDLASRTRAFPFLSRYGVAYYRGFVDRVWRFSVGRRRQYPWLREVCDRAGEFIALLLDAPTTVVHGEYYPGNIVVTEGRTCPVDWESAAVAPGELDLSALTEGWPQALADECAREYTDARWPGGAPAGFHRTLAAARLYWSFRWLGSRQRALSDDRRSESRLQRLREQAVAWASDDGRAS